MFRPSLQSYYYSGFPVGSDWSIAPHRLAFPADKKACWPLDAWPSPASRGRGPPGLALVGLRWCVFVQVRGKSGRLDIPPCGHDSNMERCARRTKEGKQIHRPTFQQQVSLTLLNSVQGINPFCSRVYS